MVSHCVFVLPSGIIWGLLSAYDPDNQSPHHGKNSL